MLPPVKVHTPLLLCFKRGCLLTPHISWSRNLPSDWVYWGELLKLICQPFTHYVSFMKASCDDLILLGAAQEQYGADENTPEHPADPFTTPRPDKGIRRPVSGRPGRRATALMPCEGR